MSLSKFDESAMLKACGLMNGGSICYLNSFLQSLLSCTAVTEFFLDPQNKQRFEEEKNTTALEYINLIQSVKAADKKDIINPKKVFDAIIAETKKRDPSKQFGRGQEDSSEGLTLFLNAIDEESLYALFMYKYQVNRWCLTCDTQISSSTDKSVFLEVPSVYSGIVISADQKTMDPLNLHVMQNMSMLEDYQCPHCKEKSDKFCTIYQLMRIPEILTITFNKFFKKGVSVYSEKMMFPGTDGNTLNYNLVARIEHSGGRGSGHYWTHGYRLGEIKAPIDDSDSEPLEHSEKKVFKLNDSIVSDGDYIPTANTYILFYHVA